jgi:hypothetical protein
MIGVLRNENGKSRRKEKRQAASQRKTASRVAKKNGKPFRARR